MSKLKLILGWFFGVAFLFSFVGHLKSLSIIASLSSLILAILLLPPTSQLVKDFVLKKYNLKITPAWNSLGVIVAIVVLVFSVPTSDKKIDSENKPAVLGVQEKKQDTPNIELDKIELEKNENAEEVKTETVKEEPKTAETALPQSAEVNSTAQKSELINTQTNVQTNTETPNTTVKPVPSPAPTTKPTPKPVVAVTPPPAPKQTTSSNSGYIDGTCGDLKKLGKGNFLRGDPNYTSTRNRDKDGVACEL